jgi:hypothetical protein
MFVVFLHINVPGTQRAFLRNRNSPISTCQLPTSYVRPPSSRAAVASGRPWPSFLFLDVGHQGFGGQRQGGDRRGVQAGAGRAVAPDREGTVVVDRVRESKDKNFRFDAETGEFGDLVKAGKEFRKLERKRFRDSRMISPAM